MSKDKVEIKKKENEGKKDDKKSHELSMRRENPFSLFQEMDKLFDDVSRAFFDDRWPFDSRRRRPFGLVIREDEPMFRTPLANISETKDNFMISAELPGMDKGDLEITIHDGMLEIKGEHRSSSYYRAFNLPEYIDENKIEANLEKGILSVKIPKVEPPKPEKKKIEIK